MKKKNILMIMTDQQRFDVLGCMGHDLVQTPNLDRLASQGHLFRNAYCASPLCVPSRVALFSGQYPGRSGNISNANQHHIAPGQGTHYMDALKQAEYRIGLAGKNHVFNHEAMKQLLDYVEEYNHHGKMRGDLSQSDKAVAKFRHSEQREEFAKKDPSTGGFKTQALGEGLFADPEPFPEEQCPTYRIAEDAIKFIEDNAADPFFLFCSFPDPHFPQVVCEPYHSMYDIEDVELEGLNIDWTTHPFAHFVQANVNGFDHYTEAERKQVLAQYYGMVTFIDKAVGMVLDALDANGLAEETIVVLTSDHGDLAGRYGMVAKTKAFYDPLIRVPLIMKVPGIDAGVDVTAQVSNIDIMPTLFELIGLPKQKVSGISFVPVLQRQATEHREEIFAEVGKAELPPDPVPHEQFPALRQQRKAENGWFWFIEYTTLGRSAMIKKDNMKFCHYVGDMDELYDLSQDPLELNNLISDPDYAEIKSSLKDRLMDWVMTTPFK